jgi:cation transport protein ChaC
LEDIPTRAVTSLKEVIPAAGSATPLSEAELLDALHRALAPWKHGTPFWIFAYGSLMWNPSFKWDTHHVALVRGYHRSFRLWSRINRGSPENPGLVLTLERGGSCRGLVYRIDPAIAFEEMLGIWRREMTFGSYLPKWLNCAVGGETVSALAFTVNRACSGYTGAIPLEVMVECMASARGRFGPAHDYLFKTTETLRTHGIRDERVEHLANLVRLRIAAASA